MRVVTDERRDFNVESMIFLRLSLDERTFIILDNLLGRICGESVSVELGTSSVWVWVSEEDSLFNVFWVARLDRFPEISSKKSGF